MSKFFLLVLCASFFYDCSWKGDADFYFYSGKGEKYKLTALSKKAKSGAVRLKEKASYNYILDAPVRVNKNSSVALSYAALVSHDTVSELIVRLEEGVSFTLPLDLNFIAAGGVESIKYAVPFNAPLIDKINFSCSGGAEEGLVKISAIGVEQRMYGYAKHGSSIYVTPFVRASSGGAGSVSYTISPFANEKKTKTAPPFYLKFAGVSGPAVFGSASGGAYQFLGVTQKRAEGAITIPPGLVDLSTPFEFTGDAESVLLIEKSENSDGAFPAPITADPGVILNMPQSSWRDRRFEIYRWDMFPQVLIFDMSDYKFQDKMLKRLAFFAEKKGYRGKIAADAELEDKHGWNAHDYSCKTLAAFYNAAKKISFNLLPEERELEEILFANKMLRFNMTGAYEEGFEGAIVSISRESSVALRSRFMAHEGFHGIFFIDKGLRDFAEARYSALDKNAKAFLRSYFDYNGYDISDNFLVLNEFMAYCLQQSPAQVVHFFGKQAPQLIDESSWRRSVLPPKDEKTESWPQLANVFSAESAAFSDYVNQRWALSAGRVWRVAPVR